MHTVTKYGIIVITSKKKYGAEKLLPFVVGEADSRVARQDVPAVDVLVYIY